MKYRKMLGVLLASSLVFSISNSVLASTTSAPETITTSPVIQVKVINTFEEALNLAIENNIEIQKLNLDKELAEKRLRDAYDLQDLSVNDIAGGSSTPEAVAKARVTKQQAERLAKNGIFLAEKNMELLKLKLKKDLEEAFLSYLSAKESVDLAQKNFDQASKNYAFVQKRFTLGLITKADLLQAESLLSQSKLGVEKAKSDLVLAKQTFNQLVQNPLDSEITLKETTLNNPIDATLSLEKLLTIAKQNRPDYLAQQTKIETENEKIGIYISIYRNKNNSNVYEQEATAKKEELNLVQINRTLELQISQLLENINLAKLQLANAEKTVASAKEVQRTTQVKFNSGLNVELEVISANNSVQEKELALVQTKYTLAKLYRTLNYTVGTELK